MTAPQTGPLTPAFEAVRALDGPATEQHRFSSSTPASGPTPAAPPAPADSAAASDWGKDANPGGWSRETKLGFAFVGILVVTFGFILWRKVDQPQPLGPETLAAGEVPPEQQTTSKPQPSAPPANPFAPPQGGEPVRQTDYTEIPRPGRGESLSSYPPPGANTGGQTSAAATPDGFAPAGQHSAFDPPATSASYGASNSAASNPMTATAAGSTGQATSTGFDAAFPATPAGHPTTSSSPPLAATPAAFEPPTDAARISTASAGPSGAASMPTSNPFAAATPTNSTAGTAADTTASEFTAAFPPEPMPATTAASVGTDATAADPFGTTPAATTPAVTPAEPAGQDQFAQASGSGSPFGDDDLSPPTPVPQRKPKMDGPVPVPVAPPGDDDWATSPATAPATAPVAPPVMPSAPAASTAQASKTADPFSHSAASSYDPPAAPPKAAAVSPFDGPGTGMPVPATPSGPFAAPPTTGTAPVLPPAAGSSASARTPATEVYEVRPGDNYWTISKSAYGTGRYFMALARYNAARIADPKKMRPGMKVMTPTPQVLETSYPELFPENAARAENDEPTGFYLGDDGRPMYRVGRNDTLGGIAHRHLGRFSRWIEIYRLNQSRLKDPNRLQLGTELVLPADASRVRVVRSR